MRNKTKRFGAMVGGLLLAASGIAVGTTAVTSSASAACYDGSNYFYKYSGRNYYPNTNSGRLTTGGSCNDINVKMSSGNRYVKVCFHPSSGGVQCQSSYTLAKKGEWRTIATNVRDNTKYRLRFLSDGGASGYYAD